MYKFIHKQLPVQFDNYFDYVHAIHKRSTRTSQMKNQLYIPRFRTNRLQRFIKYRGVKVWNDIPNEIKDNKCNFSAFKRINKKYLISQVIWFLQIKVLFFFVFFSNFSLHSMQSDK